MQLNERSLRNLEGVRPELVAVVKRAAEISPVPFVVTEGLRSQARQRELVKAGKSWTLDSRHLTGHAVDLVDADNFGYEMPDMSEIAKAMRQAASEQGVKIQWGANVKYGGDWKKQNDSPHFELDRKAYPASGVTVATKAKEVATKVLLSKPALTAAGGAVGTAVAPKDAIPPPPDMTQWVAWKTFGQTVSDLGSWAWSNPALVALLSLVLGVLYFWPKQEEAP